MQYVIYVKNLLFRLKICFNIINFIPIKRNKQNDLVKLGRSVHR